jgi:hypothetical protein
MDAMRESWTDERLDDFRAESARRFDAVDKRFDTMERKMEDGFNRVDADVRGLRGEMNERFEGLENRLAAMHRLMIQFYGGSLVTFGGVLITLLVTRV